MTQLLVSVRSAAEAKLLLDLPIGILDVKEPTAGALGLAGADVLNEVAGIAASTVPISFAAGELHQWYNFGTTGKDARRASLKPNLVKRLGKDLVARYRFVKVGLAGLSNQPTWQTQWHAFFSCLEPTTAAVPVVYLDYQRCNAPDPMTIIDSALQLPNVTTILFDTFDKSHNLFHYVSESKLRHWIEMAKRHGLQTVVAGSINLQCLGHALSANPDYIGVRGAICKGRREDSVNQRLCWELLNVISVCQA